VILHPVNNGDGHADKSEGGAVVSALLSLEGRLFVESCEVTILEGDEALEAIAECLAGQELELEPQS
jgi:hypothetical protein